MTLEENIKLIKDKDPIFAEVLTNLISFIADTYSDKYEDKKALIKAKNICLDENLGKGANMFAITKYIQRYVSEGFEKSNNPIDLKKAIHYILFELIRVNGKV